MFGKKKKDGPMHPNRKYKGVTYTRDSSASKNEYIPPHANKRRPLLQGKKQGLLDTFRKSKGTDSNTVKQKTFSSRPVNQSGRKTQTKEGNVVAFKSSRPSSKQKKAFTGSIFRDNLVRTTVFLCAFIVVGSSIAITTAYAKPQTPITLNDSGRLLQAETSAQTVGQFLDDNKIFLGEDDVIVQDLDAPITEGMEIKIWRAMPITIHSNSETTTVNMVSGTVQDAIEKSGISVSEQDEIYPAPETIIRTGMNIDHIVTETELVSEIHEIPYSKLEETDSDLDKGSTEIIQYGSNGELEIITEFTYKNGHLVSEEVISEETIKEPVSQITAVGTYVEPEPEVSAPTMSQIQTGSGGGSIEGLPVKYTASVEVTAYCAHCNSGNKTASGAYPSWGTLAANLANFPFGTKIYVPGYGVGVVQDTGGFGGKTNVIDVYLGDNGSCQCGSMWGRQHLTVSVLG